MVYGMAWRVWHGMAWYIVWPCGHAGNMVWPGGHRMVYGYGMAGIAWSMVWPGRHVMVHGMIYGMA